MMNKKSFPFHDLIPENLQILYEDNHLIAVNKPAGILVQGDISANVTLMDLIKQYIKKAHQKPGNVFLGLIHRLDRNVSGVVLFAKTSKGASRLSEQFRSRSVTKIYWSLVHGRMNPPEGILTSYLVREEKGSRLADESTRGVQKAVLTYRTLHILGEPPCKITSDQKSLLEITLHTGRKHQIRVQLSAAGCPIVGDRKYGAPYALKDKSIRLTAKSLTFKHPTTHKMIHIEAPQPEWICNLSAA